MNEASKPKISIITVSYNSRDTITKTIESVINQEYSDYEYIIIDGNSKDETTKIIKEYEESFNEKGIQYRWVSEKDKGIYDAMNKGAAMAAGEWLYYLNTGDQLYENKTLKQIFTETIPQTTALIYGDIMLQYPAKQILKKQNKVNKNYFLKNNINHQTIFFRKTVFEQYNCYDLSYPINADKDLIMKILYDGGHGKLYIPQIIAVYDMTGISSKRTLSQDSSNKKILKRYFSWPQIIMGDILRLMKIPKKIINHLR